MFCHFTVLSKLDGDVSQARAVTDPSILFYFLSYNSVFQFASSAVVSWWGCHIVVAFAGRLVDSGLHLPVSFLGNVLRKFKLQKY